MSKCKQCKEKIVMFQHFGIFISLIGMYSLVILDFATALVCVVFASGLLYLANIIDETTEIRKSVTLKDFFSLKPYTKKGFN